MRNNLTFILLGILLCATTSIFSQEKNNVLKVQGEAIFQVAPEILVVNIPIQVKDLVYENCSKQLVTKYKLLKDALVKNNIKEEAIKSDNLSVNENYTWDQRERKFDGYIGSLRVTVEQEYTVEKLSAIIETLKSEEFKFGYNISFKLSEKQKSEQLEKAINLAVEDATNKAKIIAGAMDIKLGEIMEINFGYSAPTYELLTRVESKTMMYNVQDEEGGLKLDLNPQLIQIQKSIGVIWKID